jgi:signal transduction histidine kinase
MASQPHNSVWTYLLAVIMSITFFWHRRFPISTLVVVLTSVLAYSILGYAAFPGVAAFAVLFGIAAHSDRLRSAVAFVATAVVLLVSGSIQPAGVVDRASAVATALATVVCYLAGENLRVRRARWTSLQERNEALVREQEERARQAVIEERARIARELHDVVAHAMSVIAVQAGVGHHVGRAQPAEALRALGAIETTSRSSLNEMRRLLGVLRQDGESSGDLLPAPGLRDLSQLLREVEGGGLTTRLEITGSPGDISPGLDLCAYRIVQEALTNAIKHGGARADVHLAYTVDDIRLEITNSASAESDSGQHIVRAGHGLIGMRERVAVFGGDFSAGTRPGGGFRVAARLPLTGPPT